MKHKKLLLAALTVAAALLFLSPTAFADILYPSPAGVQAGQSLNHLIAYVDSGAAVSAMEGTLPPGVELATEADAYGVNVYLRGTPQLAGSYNCVLLIGEGSSICPLSVAPATPVVASTGDVTCFPGEAAQVAVSAYTTDGGWLSYQWYFTQYTQGGNGYEISGETQPVMNVGTGVPGTSYYYCVVTNSNNGLSVSASSSVIAVTVEGNVVTGITIQSMPYRVNYALGENLDLTGLQLNVTYASGLTETVTSGFSASPTQLNTLGTQIVQIYYEGASCFYDVDITETLTETIPQMAAEAEYPVSLAVETLPAKTTYTQGENLDLSGLVLRMTTNRRNSQMVYSGFTCTPTQLNTLGRQEITAIYGELRCSFTVTVTENLAARVVPSPSPSVQATPFPTAAPTTAPSSAPLPTVQPLPVGYSAHQSSLGRSLITVIVSAAAAALAVLGIYVYAMNRGGLEALGEELKKRLNRSGSHTRK